jgi:aspartate kinase
MLEMASLGSKVLQIRSVEFAGKYEFDKGAFKPYAAGHGLNAEAQSGTLITLRKMRRTGGSFGIAFNRDEAKSR